MSRPSRDPYLSLKSQHRCQNPRSGLLCCRRLVYPYLSLDIAQDEIRKTLLTKEETE